MDQVLERHSAPEAVETIEATLNYIVNNGEKLFTETGGAGRPRPRAAAGRSIRGRWSSTTAGSHGSEFELERDGFRFVRHDTKVADFFDEDEVRRVYYPEMEALVKAESGAARVVVFDHTLRTADDEMRAERKIREVVPRAHNDYTEWSGPQRVRDILPEEADDLLGAASPSSRCGGRSAIRSRASRSRSATRAASRSTISSSRSGAIPTASARPMPSPTIRNTVVLVPAHAARGGDRVQGLRSLKDGRARWTAHTAFDDPTSPPNARPRESIEIRTLAFF